MAPRLVREAYGIVRHLRLVMVAEISEEVIVL